MQSCRAENSILECSNSSPPALELTAKDGLFIATECHLASLPDEDGDTPLHLAVVQEDLETCRKLLELFAISGKSIDVYNNLLQTPLHVAVILNQINIVELLISHNSNPYQPDRYGYTAFHLCAKYNSTECLIKILGNMDARKLDLNIRDYEGLTPLHVAVINGSVSTFKVLVANGADIDAKDNKGGRTPLIYAIEMNEKNLVELLLECDASVSQQTYSGDTALHIASGRGLQEIVRLLLRRGADATLKNPHCETTISVATSTPLKVSDILKTSYKSLDLPDSHTVHTTADRQYSSYPSRNTSLPMPPQLLRMMSLPADNLIRVRVSDELNTGAGGQLWKKRGTVMKKEFRALDSDEEIPAKRYAYSAATGFLGKAHSFVSSSVMVSVPPMGTNTTPNDGSECSSVRVLKSPNTQENSGADIPSQEEVIIADEMEISSEEVVIKTEMTSAEGMSSEYQTDDDEVSSSDSGSQRQQYSSTKNDVTTTEFAKTKDETRPKSFSSIPSAKAVIVQRQPQITMTTALTSDYLYNRSTLCSSGSFTPSSSPLSYETSAQEKSKSVPCSPQPSESNLYQLAREGLAVAAMANSAHSSPKFCRDFTVPSYMKSRPSRQAKIKSGTEELQNLALQGLAVAAMSGATFQNSQQKSSDDLQVGSKSTMTAVTQHLSKVFNHPNSKTSQPQLLRSNSLPPQSHYNQNIAHKESYSEVSKLPSCGALLALAHANARKENVGQAVSAITMSRHHPPCVVEQRELLSSPASSDVSENTKLNLRQAIMVKNINTLPKRVLNEENSLSKKKNKDNESNYRISILDSSGLVSSYIRKNDPRLKHVKCASTTLALSSDEKYKTSSSLTSSDSLELAPCRQSASSNMGLQSSTSAQCNIVKPLAKSPILVSKVISVKIPARCEKGSNVEVVNVQISPCAPDQNTERRSGSGHSLLTVAGSKGDTKSTKDVTPTNTVAPLQLQQNKSPLVSKSVACSTVVSVSLAPITTCCINSPPSMAQPLTTKMPAPTSMNDLFKDVDAQGATTEQEKTVASTSSVTGILKSTNSANTTKTTSLSSVSSLPMVIDPLLIQSRLAGTSVQEISSVPQMPLGLPSSLVLNSALTNFEMVNPSPSGTPYVQHQINYVTFGKEYVPVLMPIGQSSVAALRSQIPIPHYALQVPKPVLNMPTSQTTITSGSLSTSNPVRAIPSLSTTLASTYFSNIPGGSLYPIATASPLYSDAVKQQIEILQQQQQQQQQQYLRNALLLQQQNLLWQKMGPDSSVDGASTISAKPTAAVPATPIQKPQATLSADEQPLNLSKKMDEPLNLMKSFSTASPMQEAVDVRGSSVIMAPSQQTETFVVTTTTYTASTLSQSVSLARHLMYPQSSALPAVLPSIDQIHPGVMLPPPLVIPDAVHQTAPPASVSSLPLPPIHYVNGMPFLLRLPPPV